MSTLGTWGQSAGWVPRKFQLCDELIPLKSQCDGAAEQGDQPLTDTQAESSMDARGAACYIFANESLK